MPMIDHFVARFSVAHLDTYPGSYAEVRIQMPSY